MSANNERQLCMYTALFLLMHVIDIFTRTRSFLSKLFLDIHATNYFKYCGSILVVLRVLS
jgi:hypothetical protein